MNRAARTAVAAVVGFTPAAIWVAASSSPEPGERMLEYIAAAAVFGAPMAIAAALVVRRIGAAAQGRDWPERFLGLATAGLRGSGAEWGAAMRAELASIEPPTERRGFATGCAVSAIRIDARHWLRPVAMGTGVIFAVGTLVASRASLAGGRGGIMALTLTVPIIVLFTVTFVTALTTRSFRTGLVVGWIALLAGLIGMQGAVIVEAAHWYDVAGVYLLDGDNPKEGLDRLGAVLDPVAPTFVFFHLSFWAPWAVLGAAAGSMRPIAQRMKPRLRRR